MDDGDDLPAPVPVLFPAREERARLDDLLTSALALADERVARGSVMPTIDMVAFREELVRFDFATPQPMDELLMWTIARMEQGMVHMTNPRYFGLFNPGPSFPSQCADRITSVFNPQLASSGSSPLPVELEAHVIRAVARRAGLPPEATGHFATGGSEANYTSLLCALTRAERGFATDGVRAFSGPVSLYASRECHIAWLKVAHQAGVGRSALRLVGTDGKGRMDPRSLARAVAADRAQGTVPVLIVATAGTTGAGMIDPLVECAQIAHDHGVWFHVDAAWGGAALASDRLRGALDGIEHADSVTIDAHKWFATTMGCGMFITRHGHVLSEAFHSSTSFMPSSVASIDPYINSVQWSRRFLGLRLFLSLAAAGWDGYGAHVERSVEIIEVVRKRLVARGWTAVNESKLAVLCVVPPPGLGDIKAVVRRVLASGRAWVAPATFEGRDVLRICATHGQSTLEDVGELVAALHASD
jgi:glutamate/tyrosine decarboxylase-like PLP-dependent enzyme